MIIRDVLEEKDRPVFFLSVDHSVEDAITLMAEQETGCVLVQRGDHPVGILTMRDIVRSYVRFNRRPFAEIPVQEAMTQKLIVALPGDDLAGTLCMMTRAQIRHLPVVMDGRITSILLICDLVEHQVGRLSTELRYMEDYLSDLQEAGRD